MGNGTSKSATANSVGTTKVEAASAASKVLFSYYVISY